MITDILIPQHNEALEIAGKIVGQFDGNSVKDAVETRKLLSSLLGKLTIHLVMEDKNLYPKAEGCGDMQLSNLSKQMKTEMSGLAEAVTAYGRKWATPDLIQNNQAGFISETKQVFATLQKRIEREEKEFYPLFSQKL